MNKNRKDIAWRVIRGDFGNGVDRMEALASAGYDYATIQAEVNRYMEAKDYLEKHEKRLRKVVHAWLWKLADASFESDLYYYPDNKEFDIFPNPGGKRLEGDCIWIAGINPSTWEIEKGHFREFCNDQTDQIVTDIYALLKISPEEAKEKW